MGTLIPRSAKGETPGGARAVRPNLQPKPARPLAASEPRDAGRERNSNPRGCFPHADPSPGHDQYGRVRNASSIWCLATTTLSGNSQSFWTMPPTCERFPSSLAPLASPSSTPTRLQISNTTSRTSWPSIRLELTGCWRPRDRRQSTFCGRMQLRCAGAKTPQPVRHRMEIHQGPSEGVSNPTTEPLGRPRRTASFQTMVGLRLSGLLNSGVRMRVREAEAWPAH